jgi:CheY-like chemotaxis protein
MKTSVNDKKVGLQMILLAEDDPGDVDLMLAALEEIHLADKVVVVKNGEEAMDYLYCRGKFRMRAGGNPVVVLLDNKMPKVTGLEVLKSIRADDHLKTIPVLALTSSRETPDMMEFYRHGVNAYVVKLFDFSEFMRAVEELGAFWAGVNEPPPYNGEEEDLLQKGAVSSPGKREVNDEIPAPDPALGG